MLHAIGMVCEMNGTKVTKNGTKETVEGSVGIVVEHMLKAQPDLG